MNKQQLASTIWAAANHMRSKIEASEYKDYILGFIFYKFLSEQEEAFLGEGEDDAVPTEYVNESHPDIVRSVQEKCGYFISHDNLYSTWIKSGRDFDVSNVRDALSAFTRLIAPSRRRVFDGIFDTLETGLSKLGDTSGAQTKAIRDLLDLIRGIPMDARQGYDVLGYIYEYLISNFAANAGKKAGEFYTPHEVSLLISEIVAHNLCDRSEITIYDPTSGSGSLLINIGQAVSRHMGEADSIKYYAQELKENTYNLTRMNLVMRGILSDNIVTRNGDTLEDDWPWFEDGKPETYDPLFVDAVVSNPPYSQRWDSADKENDPRFVDYGVAPVSKADYAFLLHDLYHLKHDGVMCIVLPHGVLFRGGDEGKIRRNLIERNNIDAIIGLPANIFFGTGIPTIVMVLKKQRPGDDVLIIDASKGFVKEGKNNKLRASDIKRVVDAYVARKDVDHFCRVVGKEAIRANDYNLNIPRYVDSSEPSVSWDIYASMFGGIPRSEVDALSRYWDAFPTLKTDLFEDIGGACLSLKAHDVHSAIAGDEDVKAYSAHFEKRFSDFAAFLHDELVDDVCSVAREREEERIASDVFGRLDGIPLVDRYDAYQDIDDEWQQISIDLEIIQTEGLTAAKRVDPNMVTKKQRGKDITVQDGWIGHILPFELVQHVMLPDEVAKAEADTRKFDSIANELSDMVEGLSEEEKTDMDAALNDDNTAFADAGLSSLLKDLCSDYESDETRGLETYLSLMKDGATKDERLGFINAHDEIKWGAMSANASGVYSKAKVTSRISLLKRDCPFEEGSIGEKLSRAETLSHEKKALKKQLKEEQAELERMTKRTIEELSDREVLSLLDAKWVSPLVSKISILPEKVLKEVEEKTKALADKYSTTYPDVEKQIGETASSLSSMIEDLTGDARDIAGLKELQSLLGSK
jgi:type I restriction enzyme M protein